MSSPQQIQTVRWTEGQIAAATQRLLAAGLTAEAAAKVATHPTHGPVVLAPGVIVSLHPVRPARAEAVAS